MENFALCGVDCNTCPRYNAHSREELGKMAELWHKIGWRDRILPPEEMACTGCSSHKQCAYGLVDCTTAHGVDKCNQCPDFLCGKITEMLEKSKKGQENCKRVCTPEEYAALEKSFFHKEENLEK